MNLYNFYGVVAMSGTIAAAILGIVLSVLLGRLILVATQALRTYTRAQDLQIDLLLADTNDEPART
ncbi:hypothetical protein D6T64_00615 [Cryobacterium melibiosiphilum]|uniref:Uncharacterized protein n=1 Tax=Cryobacterium melibiosiphilum TaxID=995039 RepID=A0A3A5MXU6_9MICO|nr:hypothetical protein D6T64_00615 [Cryobacterium melibiosiphilum]